MEEAEPSLDSGLGGASEKKAPQPPRTAPDEAVNEVRVRRSFSEEAEARGSGSLLAAGDAISPAWEGEKDGVKEVH